MRRTHIVNTVRRLARRTDGQDLIEYGLLIALIAVGVVVSIAAISVKVPSYYARTAGALPGEPASDGSPVENPGMGSPGSGNPGNGNPGNDKPVGNPGTESPGRGHGGPPGGTPDGRGGRGF